VNEERTGELAADAIDETFVPRHHPDATYVELDHELVVAAAPGGARYFDAHWLDRSATVVWSSLDGEISLGALIDELSEAFGTDRATVADDVLELARTLGRAGLLDGVAFELPAFAAPARLDALPLGTAVPPFALVDLDGRTVSSESLRGRRHVLVNWSPSCGFCVGIGADLAAAVPDLHAAGIDLVLIASGSIGENRRVVDDTGLDCPVLLRADYDLFEGLGTPTAYVVAADGTIDSELGVGAVEVPALVRGLVESA
jgi:peroxiredoxin